MLETMWRCVPSRALTKLDLPTFGRPTMARPVAWSRCMGVVVSGRGRSVSMASRRSATPLPSRADMWNGSVKPVLMKESASMASCGDSTLLTAK